MKILQLFIISGAMQSSVIFCSFFVIKGKFVEKKNKTFALTDFFVQNFRINNLYIFDSRWCKPLILKILNRNFN